MCEQATISQMAGARWPRLASALRPFAVRLPLLPLPTLSIFTATLTNKGRTCPSKKSNYCWIHIPTIIYAYVLLTVDICTKYKLPFRKSTVELWLLQIKRDQDAFWTLLMWSVSSMSYQDETPGQTYVFWLAKECFGILLEELEAVDGESCSSD